MMANSEDERYACPYILGAPMTIEKDGDVRHYTISKVYMGDSKRQFSYSCTVLLQSRDTQHENHQEVVLKIIDSRFAAGIREDFDCEIWDEERDQAYQSITKDRREDFLQWLCKSATPEELSNPALASDISEGIWRSKPSHSDIYRFALASPGAAKKYLAEGSILHAPSTAYQELCLRYYCFSQVNSENHIAQIVNARLPGRLPVCHGIWRVHVGNLTSLDCENILEDKFDNVFGLLMERSEGVPMLSLPGQDITEKDIRILLQDWVLFQLQLMRCGLVLWDRNVHNFLMFVDSSKQPQIRMVDFGAISILKVEESKPDSLITCTHEGNAHQWLHNVPYSYEIKFDQIRSSMSALDHWFRALGKSINAHDQADILSKVKIADNLNFELSSWELIMFDFIQSRQLHSCSDPNLDLLPACLRVIRILNEEFLQRDSPQHWTLRSVQKICLEFRYDAHRARREMERLLALIDCGTSCPGKYRSEFHEMPLRILAYPLWSPNNRSVMFVASKAPSDDNRVVGHDMF